MKRFSHSWRAITPALAVALVPAVLSADPSSEARLQAFCAKVRKAQSGLRTVRSECRVVTLLSALGRSVEETGKIAWKRTPDGSTRQRWDLEMREDGEEPVRTTLYVHGGNISYVREGKVTDQGPLRTDVMLHLPFAGGPVFSLPDDKSMKDPDFTFDVLDNREESNSAPPAPHPPSAGKPQPPERSTEDDEGGSGISTDELLRSISLKPCKSPWTEILTLSQFVFDPTFQFVTKAQFQDSGNNRYLIDFKILESNVEIEDSFFIPPASEAPEKDNR